MGELGIDGNNYENDTFAVHSYDWEDEDNNEWHFWHKPSGLKVQWYKYPLRGFEANMYITDDQFLDALRDCTNSMEDGKRFKVLHEVRKWWNAEQTENNSEKPNNCEHITEDGVTCAKYPACDDCLDNPLNNVKGSERLVKGSERSSK